MKKKNLLGPLRPDAEDWARAAGYFVIMGWAVMFCLFPPNAFVSSLEVAPRVIWMVVTFLGAAAAFAGALLRIDIKLELPGLLLTLVGPLFYFVSQLFYVVMPDPSLIPDPTQRYALVIYAILPGFLLMPRTIGLFRSARRLKKINQESVEAARQLLAARQLTREVKEGRK